MTCRDCGKVDHAGNCDLVDFYHWQRWAVVNPASAQAVEVSAHSQEIDDDGPPRGLIDESMPPSIEGVTLAQESVTLALQSPNITLEPKRKGRPAGSKNKPPIVLRTRRVPRET